MSKASKELITKELFDIEPIMINSALLTAQQRKRLYWVGKLVDGKYRQVKIEQPKDKEIYLKDKGFPDNYVSMVSNTQGYKGLGNSFTVPVIKHIINQLNK